MAKFTLIPGSKSSDTPKQRVIDRLRAGEKHAEILECPRCDGREVLELRSGAALFDGKVSGGMKTVVCAACFMKGERIVLA
jgi:hypothetical protein